MPNHPRRIDDGRPFEVGRRVIHRPSGRPGVVTAYISPSSRRVAWEPGPGPSPDGHADVEELEVHWSA